MTTSALRVMHSPVDQSNPFFKLLTTSLPDDIETVPLSSKRGLRGDFDVLHVHWPERMMRDSTPWRTARKRVLLLLLLLVMWRRRIPIVRTLHNSVPHDAPTRVERWLLGLVDRSTVAWVCLTEATATPRRGLTRVIAHGDYEGHYDFDPGSVPEPDRMLYFGRIRPYKGVEQLVDVYAADSGAPFRLRLAGRPTTPELQERLAVALAADGRLSARLEFVPEDDLVVEIELARAVCLPYLDMENSGAMLLALTAHRPVIVPDTPTNAALAAEIGDDWVVRYQVPLDADRLRDAWVRATSGIRNDGPDLSARSWPVLASQYAAVYRDAVSARARVSRATRTVGAGGS